MIPQAAAWKDIEDPRAAATFLRIRAPQATTTSPPANTSPFFPDPSTFHLPQSSQSSPSNQTGGLAKSVLEYLFLSVALLIIGCTVFRRLVKLRRTRKPLRAFFRGDNDSLNLPHNRAHSYPRTTGLPPIHNDGQPYPPYPDPFLTGFPAVYLGHAGRRTAAGDIDINGRRLVDRTVELDHDGALGDKDALPAYEPYGGPPKYLEVALQSRLLGNETQRHSPVDASSVSVNHSSITPNAPGITVLLPGGADENRHESPFPLSATGHPSTAPANTSTSVTNEPIDN